MKHPLLVAWCVWLLILSIVILFGSLIAVYYLPELTIYILFLPWILIGLVIASMCCGILAVELK